MGKFAELFESTITEGLRLLKTHASADGKKHAKVYRDSEWEEYRVKHYSDGKHHKDADYHTDDKEDAHNRANRHVTEGMLNSLNPNALVIETVSVNESDDHIGARTTGKTHVTMHKDDAKYIKGMSHGEKRHLGGIIHSSDEHHPGKMHKVDATRDGDHIHLHDHKSGTHVATIHHSHVD